MPASSAVSFCWICVLMIVVMGLWIASFLSLQVGSIGRPQLTFPTPPPTLASGQRPRKKLVSFWLVLSGDALKHVNLRMIQRE